MPVIRQDEFGTDRAPEWCRVAGGICGMGHWVMTADSPPVERHFHDCEEFWFVLGGRARIHNAGEDRIVGPGDVVCTPMGEEHGIEEVLEAPYSHVWIACGLRGLRREGHLHR